MKPSDSPWTTRFWELIARHEILLQKRLDGVFDKQEWNELIHDLEAHLMYALANDIRRDMEVNNGLD